MRNKILLALLASSAAATCTTTVKVGTFDEANPYTIAPMTQWLDDDDVCFVFYRETSGGRSIQHLEAGDLDMAMLGSTPYATAAARRAGVSAVSILHFKGAAQALVTRPDLTAPQDLAGTVLWTPYTSTTHYILLAGLAQAGFDVDEVALVTASPAAIIEAWDNGEIDGAACWGNTMQHLLDNEWGGESGQLGRAMIDAATVAQWDFETGNVLGVSDAFLAAHGEDGGLVERVVDAFARANYDYVRAYQQDGWAAAGNYTELVDHFVYLSDSTGTEPHDWDERHDDVYDRIFKFEYPTIAEQLDFDIAAMTQKQAAFLYLQKALASDPTADSAAYYDSTFDASILEDLDAESNEAVALDETGAASRGWPAPVDAANVPPPEQYPSSADPGCATFTSLSVSSSATFDDGSSSTNAYALDATCVWAVKPDACAAVSLNSLASEAPFDVLEVFAANGDLLARYMGRHLEGSEHPAVTGCYDASVSDPRSVAAALAGVDDASSLAADADDAVALYVRWSTDGYDEHAVGALGSVGFEAVAADISACSCGANGAKQTDVDGNCYCACDPGYSGASCDHAYCMGVLDVDDGSGDAPVPAVDERPLRAAVDLRLAHLVRRLLPRVPRLHLPRPRARLRLRQGLRGLRPAPGLRRASSTVGADDYVYALTGDDVPDHPIIVAGDAFLVFESDGLTNAIVDGDSLGTGGFEVAYEAFDRTSCSDAGSASAGCLGRGTCAADLSCDCDLGYYGYSCGFDHCVGDTHLGSVTSGEILSGHVDDYPSSTTCLWAFQWGEVSGSATSDRVAVYLVEDYASPDVDAGLKVKEYTRADLEDGVFSLDAQNDITLTTDDMAPYYDGDALNVVVAFVADKNNPDPYGGFDAHFAGYWEVSGDAVTHCDSGASGYWDCGDGQVCGGNGYCVASSSSSKKAGDPTGLIVGIVFGLVGAFALVFAYRRKKIQKSRAEGRHRQGHGGAAELQGQRHRHAVRVAALQPGHGRVGRRHRRRRRPGVELLPAGPAQWYWEESPQRIQNHANVKPPFWVPYDASDTKRLEAAYAARKKELWMNDVYVVDFRAMTQTNTRSGFGRNVLRDQPKRQPAKQRSSRDVAVSAAERPGDIACDEPCLILEEGAVIQIAKQRDDGWAYGSIVLGGKKHHAPGASRATGASTAAGSPWPTDPPSSEQLAELQDALGGGGADALAPPRYWDQVKDPLVAEYFKLDPKSDEYRRAAGAFLLEDDLRKKCTIQSIERVQNISLWQSYCVRKSATVSREGSENLAEATRKYVRCWLFHGAPGDVVAKILQQGFNRSFCGKNATFFGKGVYFARDASYSAYPLYCRPDDNGVQSIFLCRVVIGQYCQGRKDALTPDIRDDSRNLLFDSTVNHVANPEIFVTYHDAQAYPEYLIKFKQSGPVGGHPQTGNRQHPRYKNWVTELEEAR
ncbi:platelet-activating factor acetyltransferase [Aureococcus anophagefferens]|nr:platelet-activating factor acetyltransferase [Aureococcus anophagefferens]